ncbi:Integrase, catalytic core [Gossypium australe]|uniref:Integrase, catalytic core n=1 Tax=Gossypium australe TaxID=47621 RepID=A0A5B6WUA0_9ROSI|nr:Integrase, catalytic core [Gossypium australe]
MHMIIEDANCKEATISKRKEISILSNLICGKSKRGMAKKLSYKPQIKHPTLKLKGNYFVCGKPGYHTLQCRLQKGRNGNPTWLNVNLVEVDDIIALVISQSNIVKNNLVQQGIFVTIKMHLPPIPKWRKGKKQSILWTHELLKCLRKPMSC